MNRNKKIVLWGTYDTGKPRIRILREGVRICGYDLIECHENIWEGIEDKSQISGKRKILSLFFRLMMSYPKLIWRYLKTPPHELVLVSYPGLLDIFVICFFSWLRKSPIAWDMFMSLYNTVVEDRRIIPRRHPVAKLIWGSEWLALRIARFVFLDTQTHARRIEKIFSLPEKKCGAVWVGVEKEKFQNNPQKNPMPSTSHGALKVLFYGQFIPLHGIEYIVEAARLLQDAEIDWLLIGKGQESVRIKQMISEDPLPRLRWVEWVEYEDLIAWIQTADLCLGIFGTSEKAASVIPNKVFQIVTSGKPLITRDSQAIRELFETASHWVKIIPPGDAKALAEAVKGFSISRSAPPPDLYREIVDKIDSQAIGKQFQSFLV